MFSSKLRSWMDAVRPRKKQQRKDKQKLHANLNSSIVTNFKAVSNTQISENEMGNMDSKSLQTIASQGARYSGANLSSPESAYSTGYSTDGTSPGAPPEYYINIRTGTRYFPSETDKCLSTQNGNNLVEPCPQADSCAKRPPPPPSARVQPPASNNLSPHKEKDSLSVDTIHINGDRGSVSPNQDYDGNKNAQTRTPQNNLNASNGVASRITEVVINSGITSPRQRNRIRTNPWLPGNNLSPGNSCAGLHRQEATTPRASLMNSPVPVRYMSPTVPCSPINRAARCESLSSLSSCSSLSAASLNWDASLVRGGPSSSSALVGSGSTRRSPRVRSASDEEDDCTLNEMMGKYDESYVYEKETDILSDSDPTDCETDIDTGQDGGDEDDPLETELDFIDNGSFLDFTAKDERNTGHCTYYNFELQRKCSRKRASRRSQRDSNQSLSKYSSEKRKRSNSSKKRHKSNVNIVNKFHSQDGTRSAGATPKSVRRTKPPISKLALEDRLRKRSNSVSIPRDPVHFFDQRDKEADKKYKELIVEAEHILKSMKCNGLSPRRVPGPANKRVELLRTENTKPDVFMKNRLIDDVSNLHLSRTPSNISPRFSPKRNHITKFINSNSPILVRREVEKDVRSSPLTIRSENMNPKATPPMSRKQSKSDLPARRSPKYRKKATKGKSQDNFSSDSENEQKPRHNIIARGCKLNSFSCPQSEPVKRKIYSNQCKAVAFNLVYEAGFAHGTEMQQVLSIEETNRKSSDNLRQQVLLNTITNLKRSLEDQSASLKQVYRSSQNLHV